MAKYLKSSFLHFLLSWTLLLSPLCSISAQVGKKRIEIAVGNESGDIKGNLEENLELNELIKNDPTAKSDYFKRCSKYKQGQEYLNRVLHRDTVKHDYFDKLINQNFTRIQHTKVLTDPNVIKSTVDPSTGKVILTVNSPLKYNDIPSDKRCPSGSTFLNAKEQATSRCIVSVNEFQSVEEQKDRLQQARSDLNTATGGIAFAEQLGTETRSIQKEVGELKAKRDKSYTEFQKMRSNYQKEAANCQDSCSPGQQERRNLAYNRMKASEYSYNIARNKYDTKLAVSQNFNVENGQQTVNNANQTVNNAHEKSSTHEQHYNRLLLMLKKDEEINQYALDVASQRLKEIELQSENNADFSLYKLATNEFTEKNKEVALSDLEVMSTAASAIYQLKCLDIKDNDCEGNRKECYINTKSYPLFKAASATYLAAQMNDTSNFNEVIKECIMKCVSIEEVKKAPQKYPGYENTDFSDVTSVCKTEDGQEGLYTQDYNSDMDKDEQFRSIVRAASLSEELLKAAELKNANRSKALEMFRAAHAAAIEEVTTKQTRVASAYAELQKAEAWAKKAKNSIDIYIAIVITLTAAAIACCASTVCPACGFLKISRNIAIATLFWHRGDLRAANADIKKWKKKLKESKLHGMMKCNYPGENIGTQKLQSPQSVPLIYNKSVLDQLVLSTPPIFQKNYISKVAAFHEWTRLISGKLQSSSYYSKFMSEQEVKSYLNKIKFSSALVGKLINHLIINKSLAQQAISEEAQGNILGLNTGRYEGAQSIGFKTFLKMKVGAWQLQTHNAAKLVNLGDLVVTTQMLHPSLAPGESLYPFIKNNVSSLNNKPITATGFPVPETRAVYLGAIVEMLINNISILQGKAIPTLVTQNNQYQRILNQATEAMTVGGTGHEDDDTITKSTLQAKCFTGSANSPFDVDTDCSCKSNNTCLGFTTPNFPPSVGPALKESTGLSFDTANALLSGDLKSANSLGGKLIAKSSNLQDQIKKDSDLLISKQSKKIEKTDSSFFTNSETTKRNNSNKQLLTETQNASSIFLKNESQSKRERQYPRKSQTQTKGIQEPIITTEASGLKLGAVNKAKTPPKLEKASIAVKPINDEINFDDIDLDGDGEFDSKVDPVTGEIISNDEYKKIKEAIKKKGFLTNKTTDSFLRKWRKNRKRSKSNGEQIHKSSELSLFNIISRRYESTLVKELK